MKSIPAINRPVIVLGAGGHAKVLVSALMRLKACILGLTDIDPAKINSQILDVEIIGDDSAVSAHSPESILLVNGIGTSSSTVGRRTIYERFSARGYHFAAVIDPLAVITGPIEFGEGVQVLANATVQPGVRLGSNTIVNTGASVDHDCVIGSHVHIAPGAILSGGIWVGDGTHVGTGASVIHNIHIGAACIIGAGAAVVSDIPDGATAFGVPARIMVKKRHGMLP